MTSQDETSTLVLVLAAPVDPYPLLLETGPKATWMREESSGVVIRTFSGQPLTRIGKRFADVREMVRFPGALIGEIGTVDVSSKTMRAYNKLALAARAGTTKPSGPMSRLTSRGAMLSILSASRIVAWTEGTVVSGWRRLLPPGVVLESSHYRVGVPSTISNSTEIQFAMLRHLANRDPISGVLIVTASA